MASQVMSIRDKNSLPIEFIFIKHSTKQLSSVVYAVISKNLPFNKYIYWVYTEKKGEHKNITYSDCTWSMFFGIDLTVKYRISTGFNCFIDNMRSFNYWPIDPCYLHINLIKRNREIKENEYLTYRYFYKWTRIAYNRRCSSLKYTTKRYFSHLMEFLQLLWCVQKYTIRSLIAFILNNIW